MATAGIRLLFHLAKGKPPAPDARAMRFRLKGRVLVLQSRFEAPSPSLAPVRRVAGRYLPWRAVHRRPRAPARPTSRPAAAAGAPRAARAGPGANPRLSRKPRAA